MADEKNREVIAGMFDRIAWRYDFLNRFLSGGTDTLWRRRAISAVGRITSPETILDVATGTGDLAIASLRLKPVKVTGIDISAGMLEEARRKIVRRGLEKVIEFHLAPSEEIPFGNDSFDVVMAAFGVRNFSDTLGGLSEMYRVLKDDGVVMVLEFSKPTVFPFKQVYGFYFRRVLPLVGRLFSRDSSAYTYLPESVSTFPEGDAFLDLMREAGFGSTAMKRLSGGIASIYTGRKIRGQ